MQSTYGTPNQTQILKKMASLLVQSPSVPAQSPLGTENEIQAETNNGFVSFRFVPYGPSVSLQDPYPPNTVFPLALSLTKSGLPLGDLTDSIKQLSAVGKIEELLNRHGAIYFKDLGLGSAEEFSQFAQAFGWLPHEDIGNPVRRTVVAYNVATANEGPNTMPVYPHNEFGLSPHYPAYVFFYCASAPETGGETPINNSIVLYERLKEAVPEFLEELEEKVGNPRAVDSFLKTMDIFLQLSAGGQIPIVLSQQASF